MIPRLVAGVAVAALLASCSSKVPAGMPVGTGDPKAAFDAFAPAGLMLAREQETGATPGPRRGPRIAIAKPGPAAVAAAREPALRLRGAERELLDLMNAARPRSGARPVRVSMGLSNEARAHSSAMARDGDIYHSKNLTEKIGGYRWREAGENVGMGTSAAQIHAAFMRSPSHRSNIMHRAYRTVGVGVTRRAGTLYVTVLFLG